MSDPPGTAQIGSGPAHFLRLAARLPIKAGSCYASKPNQFHYCRDSYQNCVEHCSVCQYCTGPQQWGQWPLSTCLSVCLLAAAPINFDRCVTSLSIFTAPLRPRGHNTSAEETGLLQYQQKHLRNLPSGLYWEGFLPQCLSSAALDGLNHIIRAPVVHNCPSFVTKP